MKVYFKKVAGIALVLTLIILLCSTGIQGAESKKITILQTSDIHGYIYPWAYKTGEYDADVGLAKIATLVKQIKAENPNSLLVDSGDTIQGSTLAEIFKNRSDIEHPLMKVMNFMNYDAWVLGNHEFNFGLETLNRIIKDADFPVLSANIRYRETGETFVTPYIIKEVDGIKVGILGLTTPNIPRWDGDKVQSLVFDGMSKTAKKYIPELKDKGADIIIAVAHAGLEGRYRQDGGDRVSKIAEENPEIAAIFCGHDHVELNTTVNGVLIVAPEDKGHQLVKVDLWLTNENGKWIVTGKQATHLSTYQVEADKEVIDVAAPYHEETIAYVNTPIGEATGDFVPPQRILGIPEAQVQDTALMDLINRVQMKYTNADISSAALFDWASTIKKGPVSIKDAARIYKYSNTLYAVKVTGKELKDYMEWSAAYYNTYRPGDVTISFDPQIRGYNYDMFSGVEYKIDISKPVGKRIVDLKFKGKPVRDDQEFILAVNNYRYSGLKADGIIHNEPIFKSEKTIRDMIIEYIKENKVIEPVCDHNWEIIGADLNHWAKEEGIYLLNKGIIEIPSENRSWNGASLNLNEKVTRETFIKALVRLFNLDVPAEVKEPVFNDVNEELLPFVEAAYRAGVVAGTAKGRFSPEKLITREEACVMFMNAMGVYGVPPVDLAKYKDSNEISKWAYPAVVKAISLGLLGGYEDNTLRPKSTITMGQLVSMFHKYLVNYRTVDILSTNDFHGNVEGGYEAGAAKFAAVVEHYRSQNPEGTILLDGGDAYQGTPISTLNEGMPVVEIFNYLGYTAQAVGNHEFDWGMEVLKKINENTSFPLLTANIYDKNTGKPVEWADPYIIVPVNGIDVGIIGISTPDTKNTTMPSHISDLDFKDPVPIINDIADRLRNMGTELVIVLSHLPGHTSYDTGEVSGELVEVAKKARVDGIIGGHSHGIVAAVVNGVPVVEAYKNGRMLGHLRYYINNENNMILKALPVVHEVRRTVLSVNPDVKVAEIVFKYQKELEPIMNEVLTNSGVTLKRNYNDISNIGILITEVMKQRSGADLAFQNPGGIRIDIPAGDIKVGDIYTLLPFGNTIVTGKMTGRQIVEILEQSFTLDKGMMQLAGIKVEYDSTRPEYNRVVKVMLEDGTPLEMDKTYIVATNNFLAEGGDKFSTFKEVKFTDTYIKVRDAVIEYLRSQETIEPAVDDRVIDVSRQSAASTLVFRPAA